MKGKITLAASSDRLRQAIPLMSKYKIPATPQNYWVWYEFVGGGVPAITETIDRLTQAGEPIDEVLTRTLYERHIETRGQEHVESVEEAIRQLIETMSSSLATADAEVVRYETSLGQQIAEFSPNISTERFKEVVDSLVESTQQMQEGSGALHTHLEESRREVKVLKEELAVARTEAKTDPLTGLANRNGFEEGIEAISRSTDYDSTVHTLLIADIDRFKSVNDNYGHLFGDKVIKAVAKALENLTKGKDIAARFGGEEFVVVLPGTDMQGGRAVAESLRRSIEKGRIFNPKTNEEISRVTISIGATEFDSAEQIDAVIERADAALYRAKENGRNRVETTGSVTRPKAVSA